VNREDTNNGDDDDDHDHEEEEEEEGDEYNDDDYEERDSKPRFESYTNNSEVFELDPLRKMLLQQSHRPSEDRTSASSSSSSLRRPSDASDSHDSFVLTPITPQVEGISPLHRQRNSKLGLTSRLLQLLLLIMFIVSMVIGPNILYVIVIVGKYSYFIKTMCTLAIAFVKVSLTSITIPKASERTAVLLYPGATSGFRFRLSVNIGVSLAAISLVIAPIVVVAITDQRCWYYYFEPESDLSSPVFYDVCNATDLQGQCLEYTSTSIQSNYKPLFSYDGDQCVTAMLSTYAPVFLAYIMLSAPISATLDLLVVPLLAPWCYRNADHSRAAELCLKYLKKICWNVPSVLCANFNSKVDVLEVTQGVNLKYASRSVMRRALVQFSSTLLIALTFGLAAPMIGLACIFAAILDFRHHSLVISQIVSLGEVMPKPSLPDMKGCSLMPRFTCFVVIITVLAYWCCAMVDYMNAAVEIVSFMVVLVLFMMLCVGYMVWLKSSSQRHENKNKKNQRQGGGGDDALNDTIDYDNKLLNSLMNAPSEAHLSMTPSDLSRDDLEYY
jgi:hypothetical protein